MAFLPATVVTEQGRSVRRRRGRVREPLPDGPSRGHGRPHADRESDDRDEDEERDGEQHQRVAFSLGGSNTSSRSLIPAWMSRSAKRGRRPVGRWPPTIWPFWSMPRSSKTKMSCVVT